MKKRNLLKPLMNYRFMIWGSLFVLAFLFTGEEAQAQKAVSGNFHNTSTALQIIETEAVAAVGIANQDSRIANTPSVITFKSQYYNGIGREIAQGQSVSMAITMNHIKFVNKYPTIEQIADTLKDEAIDDLTQ